MDDFGGTMQLQKLMVTRILERTFPGEPLPEVSPPSTSRPSTFGPTGSTVVEVEESDDEESDDEKGDNDEGDESGNNKKEYREPTFILLILVYCT